MERINIIKNQLNCTKTSKDQNKKTKKNKEKNIVKSAYDYLNFDQFLTSEEREYRLRLRSYLEIEVKKQIIPFNEKTDFPYEIVRNLVEKFPGVISPTMRDYGGEGLSPNLAAAICMELARIDMSLTAFCTVQGEVVMKSILLLGNETQKKNLLPKLNSCKYFGAFCLTEPNNGSNAYGIETSATEDSQGNFIINGTKRWIGQGSMADIYVVWARNQSTNEVQGFIVEKTREGVSSKKIENKLAFRSVHNAEVYFNNVKIPKSNKLEKANNFTAISDVFLGSRLGIGFAAAGLCIGAYDILIEYLSKRTQFGKTLTSFQLVQEKLARIMADTQAILFLTKRVSDLNCQGKTTMGMAAMCKSWTTSKARDTLRIARELMGGNGILNENYIMRALSDLEGLYTAEGTYEINSLMTGKELTGKLALV